MSPPSNTQLFRLVRTVLPGPPTTENPSGSWGPECLAPCITRIMLGLKPVERLAIRMSFGTSKIDIQLPTDCGRTQSIVSTQTVIPRCIESILAFLTLVSSPPTYLKSEGISSTIVEKEATNKIWTTGRWVKKEFLYVSYYLVDVMVLNKAIYS